DLANDIEGFMATAGSSRVNIVGHSQGGIDLRKAARVLYERRGYTVVSQAISISSPHRGSPVAKYILDLKPGVTSVIAALADYDGLVGINSQQMGYRLHYTENLFSLDTISTDTSLGYVSNLNAPAAAQMTSMADVIDQDHLDVVGVGPDTFDEMEFYAAIFNY